MYRRFKFAFLLLGGAGLWAVSLHGADWLTHSGDPQRTGWQQAETTITKDNVKDFQLLWKLTLPDNEQKALHSLMEPLIIARVITNHGFKEVALVGGSSDNIYSVDADLGKILWKKHFQYSSETPQPTTSFWLCPGGLTATPVVPPLPIARAGSPSGRFGPRGIYILSSDGQLHQLNLTNGEDLAPPAKFVPPNGKPYSLNVVDNVIYTATGQHCGGNPNGVYALDLTDMKVSNWSSNGGGLWGLAGPAVGTDGTIYSEVGDGNWDPAKGIYSDTFVALEPKTLKLKDWYTPTNREWMTKRDLDLNDTPVVFPYKGRDLLAGSGKEGRLYLLDSKSLGGENHRTPLFRTQLISNEDVDFAGRGTWGSLASWQDASGTRWVLAPVWGPLHPDMKFPITNGDTPQGSIVAFKVEESNGKTVLTPAWVSRNLVIPAPPVIANGVVFALSSGEYVRQANENQGGLFSPEQRAQLSTHAILYALDAATGKELYSSGDAITSFTHFAGMAVANGRVYFSTFDNTLYSFGFPIEH
jgi:outer membrane protein assembly factor BamB